MTASIGLALGGADDPREAVIARADAALYAAKNGGRNRVVERRETASGDPFVFEREPELRAV